VDVSCNNGVVTARQVVDGKLAPFEDADIVGKHVFVNVPTDGKRKRKRKSYALRRHLRRGAGGPRWVLRNTGPHSPGPPLEISRGGCPI
jgi:hypothetical protein